MAEFARRGKGFRVSSVGEYGKKALFVSVQAFFLVLVIFCVGVVETSAVEKKGTICVLPFQVNASKSFGHLQEGLQKMLTFRMGQNGFKTVPPETINKEPIVFSKVLQDKILVRLGNRFKAGWMVKGSITQVGDKGSIDLKVVDVSGKKMPFFIFQVIEDMDEIPESVKRLALNVEDRITGVPQVDSIHVAGNRRIEKAAILAVVGTQPGDRLNLDKLDKYLRDIYKMGYFKDVTMDVSDGPAGKVITFNVVEKPSVGKIVFVGNDEIDDEDLQKELGINLYSILDFNAIKHSVNRLTDMTAMNSGISWKPVPNGFFPGLPMPVFWTRKSWSLTPIKLPAFTTIMAISRPKWVNRRFIMTTKSRVW
ncbi:MAG: hypothetical protein B6240_13770 [Desulfobacteraceae bacterium 4572_87]|nr:MAG: hypothetical protein B6240_13770 [Desulfobacteraceae bacterium 4572_87]